MCSHGAQLQLSCLSAIADREDRGHLTGRVIQACLRSLASTTDLRIGAPTA